MTTLIIDNYDSFTWNLFQLFGSLGESPHVIRNDAITIDDIRAIGPDRIVLSPGPGRPDEPGRIGICAKILDEIDDIPILGVCLGHQAIVWSEGGRIINASRPMHGKPSAIEHNGTSIFRDLPRPFEAMRYHSLTAEPESIPSSLEVIAWCNDPGDERVVMAVRHRTRPIIGVQFHPESIGTKVHGPALCKAFSLLSAL